MITLHVWEPPEGGVSKWWLDDAHVSVSPVHQPKTMAFFAFGRFASGWWPLCSFANDLEHIKSEAQLAVRRVRERFGRHAAVIWGPPPEGTFEE
jgi:hypothetical protein